VNNASFNTDHQWLATDCRRVTLGVNVEAEVATMAAPQPKPTIHARPWTLDEWLALPEGPPHMELVDGLLVVNPVPAYRHQRLMMRLWRQLDAAATAEYEVLPDSNVALGGDRALIPDLCVIDRPGFDGVILSARHVVLVGEIASPSTCVYDRTTKRALYAEAGVPYLLMVDPSCQPSSAVCYELLDGEYVERVRSEGGLLLLDQPFPVRLDLTLPASPAAV
jgi:Uma2 family endonuclease